MLRREFVKTSSVIVASSFLPLPYFGSSVQRTSTVKKREITHMSYCTEDFPNLHSVRNDPTQKMIEVLPDRTTSIYFWSNIDDKYNLSEICYKSTIDDNDKKLRFDNCVCSIGKILFGRIFDFPYPKNTSTDKYVLTSARKDDPGNIYMILDVKRANIFEKLQESLQWKYSREKVNCGV